jgi:hypothetical protein
MPQADPENGIALAILAMVLLDGVMLWAGSGGWNASSASFILLNLAIAFLAQRRRSDGGAADMKRLPALAAGGTLVVEVTRSRIRLVELLASSPVQGVRAAFVGALAACYRGEAVNELLRTASRSLPYEGMRKGLEALIVDEGVEDPGSEASLSALDLSKYYDDSLQTIETRASLLQTAAFFTPVVTLIVFTRFLAGPVDALVATAFMFSMLRYVNSLMGL